MKNKKSKDIPLYQNIRKIRKERGLSQTELAKLVGYADKTMISHIENGLIDLSRTKVEEFAAALNVSPAYLMGWEKEDSDKLLKITLVKSPIGAVPNHKYNDDIDEVRKKIAQIDTETTEALEMWRLYQQAPEHIRSAVESLLKGASPSP